MTHPTADSRAVEVRTDDPAQHRSGDPADPESATPVSAFAVPGLSLRQPEGLVVGSADAVEEHNADAVARRVVATLRARRPADGTNSADGTVSGHRPPEGPMVTVAAGRSVAGLAALRRQAATAPASIGRSGGPATGNLATRLRRAQRGGGEPLAPVARQAFESALGTDLGGIRLHAGVEAAALSGEVGAQAFTIGRDIFFAAGWPDLGTEGGQHLLAHELAHATAPEASAVRREVVTQLVTEAGVEQPTVTEVLFAGRPENSYTGSMGDHTTAFTVHVKGIKLALEGKPLNTAVSEMRRLAGALLELPGAQDEYVAGLQPRQAKLFRVGQARLLEASQRLTLDSSDVVGALQNYISAYLELREVVPFSTINTSFVTSLRGKGKGEHVEALVDQASGKAPPVEEVYAEVVGSFDVHAVARACAESDPGILTQLSPGLPAELSSEERAKLFVEQHLQSIELNYPGTLAALAKLPSFQQSSTAQTTEVPAEPTSAQPEVDRSAEVDGAAVRRLVAADLLGKVASQVTSLTQERLRQWLHDLAALQKQLEQKSQSIEVQDNIAAVEKRGDYDRLLTKVHSLQDLLKLPRTPGWQPPTDFGGRGRSRAKPKPSAQDALGTKKPSGTKKPVESKKNSAPKKKRKQTPKDDVAEPSDKAESSGLVAVEPTVVPSLVPGLDAVVQDSAAPNAPVQQQAEEELTDQGPLTIQVQLDKDGNVAGFRAGGRTKSPFSGTMGAHTTAWVVHLDRVRALIRGKSVLRALSLVIEDLELERAEIRKLLGPAFELSYLEEETPENQSDVEFEEQDANLGQFEERDANLGQFEEQEPLENHQLIDDGMDLRSDHSENEQPDFYTILSYPLQAARQPAEQIEQPVEQMEQEQITQAKPGEQPLVEQPADLVEQPAELVETELVETGLVDVEPNERALKSVAKTGSALVALQKAIGVHLQDLNLIPGITLPAAETGGDSEGTHRGVLLEHIGQERFRGRQKVRTAEELAAAIRGMLDISSLVSTGIGDNSLIVNDEAQPPQRLAHLHLAMIKRAYGDVLSADYPTAKQYVDALIEAVTARVDGVELGEEHDVVEEPDSEDEGRKDEDRKRKKRKLQKDGKSEVIGKVEKEAEQPATGQQDDDLAQLDGELPTAILQDLTARWDEALLAVLRGTDPTGSGTTSELGATGQQASGELPLNQ